MKKILLLYKGYPRLGQSYQIDEANELKKRYQLLIISWDWQLIDINKNAHPYLFGHPLKLLNDIKKFKPDIIHSNFIDTIELVDKLSKELNIDYTIRTHSFDILLGNLEKYKPYIMSSHCKKLIVFPTFAKYLLNIGIPNDKIYQNYPQLNIKIFSSIKDLPNGQDIMNGGALLSKKNIEDYILLAKKIKQLFPNKKIRYYAVNEDVKYYNSVIKFNKENGNPVEFITCPREQMPFEYKKHQWLIYCSSEKIPLVGYPLMVSEAQACGVGVILYNLREDMIDYVSNCGYLYKTHEEVMDIIKNDFDPNKRQFGYDLASRYDIETNIINIENIWFNKY
jgi:glycosyltransferase involved in cell wall biosynthesis